MYHVDIFLFYLYQRFDGAILVSMPAQSRTRQLRVGTSYLQASPSTLRSMSMSERHQACYHRLLRY